MDELEDLERENEQLKKETVDLAKEVAIKSWGCLWGDSAHSIFYGPRWICNDETVEWFDCTNV